jgi:hypothetical protein
MTDFLISNTVMNPKIIDLKEDEMISFFIQDAKKSLLRVMNWVEKPSTVENAEYDRLLEAAIKENQHPFEYAAANGYSCNIRLANAFLYDYFLVFWKSKGKPPFQYGLTAIKYIVEVWKEKNDSKTILFQKLIGTVRFLVILDDIENPTDEQARQMGEILFDFSTELENLGEFDLSVACFLPAAGLSLKADPEFAAKISNRLIDGAVKHKVDDISSYLMQHITPLERMAKIDSAKQILVYQALERLIWYLLIRLQAREEKLNDDLVDKIIFFLDTHLYCEGLKPLFFYGYKLAPAPDETLSLDNFYTVFSKKTMQNWSADLMKGTHVLMAQLGDSRFNLLTREDNVLVHFNNWSVQHKKMLQAIPHSRSILKEESLHNILLDLKHEFIHVFSLFGSVGTCLNIMRWGLVEVEVDLLLKFFSVNKIPVSEREIAVMNFLKNKMPVQLTTPGWEELSLVERSVEIERKIQILENIWTPWFEGLAIWGEMVDDPTLDKIIESPPTTVLRNIVDFDVAGNGMNNREEVIEKVQQHVQMTERLYSTAINKNAAYKLRMYLTKYHKNYLPGYFCVRSIVSKWRQEFKKESQNLRADQAFRILLHMTRFNNFEAIPDLSLPESEFYRSAIDKHVEWVESIRKVDCKELITFLTEKDKFRSARWEKGKLKPMMTEDAALESSKIFLQKASEILRSLTGIKANINRVPLATDDLKEILKVAANQATTFGTDVNILNENNVHFLLSRNLIQPFAEVQCPFWLIQDGKIVCCHIRTREMDVDQGGPSYNLLAFVIPESESDYLKTMVSMTGDNYLTLYRVVVLGGSESDGDHFYVFKYREWLHIQKAGVILPEPVGQNVVSHLTEWFNPTPGIQFQEAINAEPHPCIQRTKTYLDIGGWDRYRNDDTSINLQSWSDYVRSKCNSILENKGEELAEVSKILLKTSFGNDRLVDALWENGINTIGNHDGLMTGRFINFLQNSAWGPLPDNQDIQELNAFLNEINLPIVQKNEGYWDITN